MDLPTLRLLLLVLCISCSVCEVSELARLLKHPSSSLNAVSPLSHSCLYCLGSRALFSCGVTTCGPDELCSIESFYNGQVTYFAGCMTENKCKSMIAKGHLCGGCCEGPNCNKDIRVCSGGTIKWLTTPPPTTTTTTTTTTITPTTTTTTTTTTTIPTTTTTPEPTKKFNFYLSTGLQCEVCSGVECGVSDDDDKIQTCPDAFPYCMTLVENDASGNKLVTKKCASPMECERRWWAESSRDATCLNYDPADIYDNSFTCSYCCETSFCNKNVVPRPDTLFAGK